MVKIYKKKYKLSIHYAQRIKQNYRGLKMLFKRNKHQQQTQPLKFKLDARIISYNYLNTIYWIDTQNKHTFATLAVFVNHANLTYHCYFASDDIEFTTSAATYELACEQVDKILKIDSLQGLPIKMGYNLDNVHIFKHNLIDGVKAAEE